MNKLLKPLEKVNTNPTTTQLEDIIEAIQNVVSVALGLITVAVIIYAVFLAVKFFYADTEDKRKNAKAQLIYALIGVVVLLVLIILAPQITTAISNAAKQGDSSSATGVIKIIKK